VEDVMDAIGDLPPIEDGDYHSSHRLHSVKKLNPRYKVVARQIENYEVKQIELQIQKRKHIYI